MAANPNKLVVDVEELKKNGGGGGSSGKALFDSKYLTTQTELADNSELEIPLYYEVGNGSLTVYFMGEKLIKADPTSDIDGHYVEVGTKGETSNKIQWHNIGQSIPKGVQIDFVVAKGYN